MLQKVCYNKTERREEQMETKYERLKIEIKEKGGKIMKKFLKITGITIALFIVIGIIAAITSPDSFKEGVKDGMATTQEAPKAAEVKKEATPTEAPISLGEKNALRSAKSYLNYTAFSKKGLIEQLKFEGFSDSEANYAVNNVNVDWNEQAAKCAENYLRYTSFSKQGLIDQLKFEGFTQEQAEYGATAVGY